MVLLFVCFGHKMWQTSFLAQQKSSSRRYIGRCAKRVRWFCCLAFDPKSKSLVVWAWLQDAQSETSENSRFTRFDVQAPSFRGILEPHWTRTEIAQLRCFLHVNTCTCWTVLDQARSLVYARSVLNSCTCWTDRSPDLPMPIKTSCFWLLSEPDLLFCRIHVELQVCRLCRIQETNVHVDCTFWLKSERCLHSHRPAPHPPHFAEISERQAETWLVRWRSDRLTIAWPNRVA